MCTSEAAPLSPCLPLCAVCPLRPSPCVHVPYTPSVFVCARVPYVSMCVRACARVSPMPLPVCVHGCVSPLYAYTCPLCPSACAHVSPTPVCACMCARVPHTPPCVCAWACVPHAPPRLCGCGCPPPPFLPRRSQGVWDSPAGHVGCAGCMRLLGLLNSEEAGVCFPCTCPG